MQVTYRYTDREYVHSRRVNRLLGIPKWKSLGLALICLLPSVVLILFTFSFIAIIAFAAVAAYLIVMISLALIKQPQLSDKHDHVLTLTPETLHEACSNSEYELRWQYFDEFSETESEFQLRRLDRHILLPKRIFTPAESEQLRSLAKKVDEVTPDEVPPIPMFARLFSQGDQNRVYRFSYQPNDLIQAASDRLVLVDADSISKPRKKLASNRLVASWLAIFVLVSVFLLRTPGDSNSQWTSLQILFLLGALLLPFLLLFAFTKIVRGRSARRLPQVPLDENRLVLLKQGFGIGTPNNATFYDWRDIDSFYENSSCYGFKSFNELIHVIPKRIFADQIKSSEFLNQAISLHREYRRTFESSVSAVETGNPYQPPST